MRRETNRLLVTYFFKNFFFFTIFFLLLCYATAQRVASVIDLYLGCLFPPGGLKPVSSNAGWCRIQIWIYPVVLNRTQRATCLACDSLPALLGLQNLTPHLPDVDKIEPCHYKAPSCLNQRSLTQGSLI